MRTGNENKEATEPQTKRSPQMIHQMKAVIDRSDTLAQDFVGAAALVVMLLAGLHLPGLV